MSLKAMTCAMAMRGVTASEKLLLLALANYADEDMRCFPSQKRLSEDACLTPRTVRALLASLEERRLISREHRERSDGSRTSDMITLHFAGEIVATEPAQISGGAEMVSGGVRKSLPGGAEMVSGLTTFEPVNEPVNGTKEDSARGSRLSPDWRPRPDDLRQAMQAIGPNRTDAELAKFHDYWRAVPGAKGRKTDWNATFRNWIRRAAERTNDQPRSRTKSDHLAAVYGAMGIADDYRPGAGGHPQEPGSAGGMLALGPPS